jgi:hypothetical protein
MTNRTHNILYIVACLLVSCAVVFALIHDVHRITHMSESTATIGADVDGESETLSVTELAAKNIAALKRVKLCDRMSVMYLNEKLQHPSEGDYINDGVVIRRAAELNPWRWYFRKNGKELVLRDDEFHRTAYLIAQKGGVIRLDHVEGCIPENVPK